MSDKIVCELCGHDHTDNITTWRTVYINNDWTLHSGYYAPRSLTTVEKQKLGKREHTICSTRKACLRRQYA